MEAIKSELGGSFKVFLLSVPLDVITFLSLIIAFGSVAWQYVGGTWGKSPTIVIAISAPLFALYYIFLRKVLLEHRFLALLYFVVLSSVTVLLPILPTVLGPLVLVVLSVVLYSLYDSNHRVVIPVAKIQSNINGVYVQQFLANAKSTFEAYRELFRQGKSGTVPECGLPEMISAYPRRLLQNQLNEKEIEAAIERTIEETGLSARSVNRYINRELDAFLQTQRETTVYGYEKVRIRELAADLESVYSDLLYNYTPLHYEGLKKISEAEGLEVIKLKNLEVLAGLITYINTEGQRKYAILMKDDDAVHQALKEFSLAHELGHWVAHIKGKKPEELADLEFYLNSLHDLGQFEDEANKMALIILFPTAYLALCDVNKTINEEKVFSDYLEGMRDTESRAPGEQLEENMMGFIKMRIGNYQKYRHTWLQQAKLLEKRPLSREFIKPLANYINEDFAWAELDATYEIVNLNEKFARLVGSSKAELLRMKVKVTQLSEPKSRHVTVRQLDEKRKDLTPKFYVTRYKNLQTGEVIPVTIYALPIVENNQYTGSFGIVTTIHDKANAAE
jgi:PAS domain S-box-containing protein